VPGQLATLAQRPFTARRQAGQDRPISDAPDEEKKIMNHHRQAVAVYRQTVLIGRTPDDVMRELRARRRTRELHSSGDEIRPITRGPHAGHYGIPVYLRVVETPDRPAWPAICVGVSAALVLLAGLLWWVLVTLSATALVTLIVGVLTIFVYGVRRATRVTVVTTTRMTVR
jgi:hypothetical protein